MKSHEFVMYAWLVACLFVAGSAEDEKTCEGEPEKGTCNEDIVTYYFDVKLGKCRIFIYTGCGGNGNRYETEEECTKHCIEPPTESSPSTITTILGDVTNKGLPETPSTAESTILEENSTVSENDTIINLTTKPDGGIEPTDDTASTTVYDDDGTESSTVTGTDIPVTNVSFCASDPCANGGACNEDLSIPTFNCTCTEGFVGVRCQTTDLCVRDEEDGEVCKNGACVYSKDGLKRSCYCFIGDYWDSVTSECKKKMSVCDSSPCGNGGTCTALSDSKYNCTCQAGFSGTACEITDRCVQDEDCVHGTCDLAENGKIRSCKCQDGYFVDEESQTCKAITTTCDSNPCKNGGICSSLDNTYNCTCNAGFSGYSCEITDWCSNDEDCGHGVCELPDGKMIRSCYCDDGFYLDRMNHTCMKISTICDANPCLHDGICTVLSANDFNCTCSDGYSGKTCNIRDMCVMDGGDAFCGQGSCVNNRDLGVYYCTCADHEYFHYTERKCVAVDLCPLMQCRTNENCKMGICECKENYQWNNDTLKCEPNFCASRPCPVSEMTCAEGTDGTNFKCSCQEGRTFNGTHCNEALCSFPHLNQCDQFCTIFDDRYECSCDENFLLKDDNHTCEYIGNNTCANKTCDKGSCVLKSDMEVCLCPPGFIEVDGKCTDICSAGNLSMGLCPTNECEVIADGSFRCKCEGKFKLSDDKITCTVRNLCQENEPGSKRCSKKNAFCVQDWEVADGFKCVCSSGSVMAEDGTCRDPCSTESNQRMCSMKGATCESDRSGSVQCRCPPYFQMNQKDGRCSKPADISYMVTLPLDSSTYASGNRNRRSLDASIDYQRISTDVTMTIEEMFVGFKQANVLNCNVTRGFVLCKIELQFMFEHETQLKRLEAEGTCLASAGSNKCLLPPKLVLVKNRISRDVIITPTDPCDEYIKEEICGSETTCSSSLRTRSFNCSCKPGFSMRKKSYPFGNDRSFVESCRDIDECVETDPCPSNSVCSNTIGSFNCRCRAGFRNVADDRNIKCVEICDPNPCTHGLCSERGDHDFDCKCDAGYRGALCDLQDENFKRARNNTIIVGVVLGGVLLITFILFAVCVSRLKKRKYLESSGSVLYNSTEMKERGRINNAFQRE